MSGPNRGGGPMVGSTARLRKDYMRLKRDPVPYISAEPLPDNMLEWHYCVRGPADTPYHGGFYHGWLVFPYEFPFKPPAIYMRTPSGRFKTNTRLCLSISDFHPDTWNPAWSVSTILTGLLSFMLETTPTHGSCESSAAERQHLAAASLAFNLRSAQFCALFPTEAAQIRRTLRRIEADGEATTTTTTTVTGGGGGGGGGDDADAEAEAAVRPRLLVQRGRERRERQRAEKAAAAAAAAAEAQGAAPDDGDDRAAAAADGTARRRWPLGGGVGLVQRLRLATVAQATRRAAGEWRTVAANAAVLAAFAAFVALASHVIRSQAGDE